jgi:hypothetical protein
MDEGLALLLLTALAIVLIVAIVAYAVARAVQNRRLRKELPQRFGPEYENAVAQYGSRDRADRALIQRLRRAKKLQIHPLRAEARERFAANWAEVQSRFVDDPINAVHQADRLVAEVMYARGYPTEHFDDRVSDVSVDHPHVVQHYRAARALAESSRRGEATTEDLRQAMVHYRFLFSELLESPERPQPYGAQQEVGA